MNLFIIGCSGAGKTSLATFLAEKLGMVHVPGSEWVRKRFPGPEPEDRAERARVLTAFAIEELKREPFAAVAYIESKYDLSRGGYIIDGARSIGDFVHLFDQRQDLVVHLSYINNQIPATDFEAGLGLIADHLRLQTKLGLFDRNQVLIAKFDSFASPCKSDDYTFHEMRDEVLAKLKARLAETRATTLRNRPRTIMGASVHQAPPHPLRVLVRAQYLYDMAPEKEGLFEEGMVTEVSSYVGSVPTFSVLLNNGAVFSYLPPHAIVTREGSGPYIDAQDLAPFECPSDYMEVSAHPTLGVLRAHVTFPRTGEQRIGQYLMTLDWVTGNDLAHVILLNNGQLAIVPQHKVLFKDGELPGELPPYKKLRKTWHVTRPQKG